MEKLWSSEVGISFWLVTISVLGDFHFGKPRFFFSLPDPFLPRVSLPLHLLPPPISPSSSHLLTSNLSQNIHQTTTYNPRQALRIESKCRRRNHEPKFPKTHKNCQTFRSFPAKIPATPARTIYWALKPSSTRSYSHR